MMADVRVGSTLLLSRPNTDIEINIHISNSYPITHTVYVRNTLKKSQNAKVNIPLDVGSVRPEGALRSTLDILPFNMPAVCRRDGANLQVTNLRSGRSSVYKLPIGATVIDEFGRAVGEGEIACEKVFVRCDVKLAGFEEKVLKIIKGEGGLSRKSRKEAFLGSLENLKITGRLEKLFETKIVDGTDEKLVASLKEAVKNFQDEVFFALLAKKETLTADVFALLVERVIGIKLLRGKIQLMPCIVISGSFELSFSYNGTKYNFKVTERGSGFTVNYGGTEFKNFLQVAVE
jgi:hypothetical protein